MFNTQYNNQDLQQLNGLMGELQQNYSIQSVPKQKKVKSFNSVTDKLREEAKKQQLANDKLNSYTNSRDMYEHGNVHQQYVNPHANSSLTGINSYKKSLNQDNMFPKDLRENINNKMEFKYDLTNAESLNFNSINSLIPDQILLTDTRNMSTRSKYA